MSEQHPQLSNIAGSEVLRKLLNVDSASLINTNGRYNLAIDDKSFDMSQLDPETQAPAKRFLVIQAEPTVGGIEARLDEAQISTLTPGAVVDNHVVYELPIGAKPLDKERFFPDRASTETYISDEELCNTLGQLWGSIYKATGQLPTETPLKHTGMLEFSGRNVRLFPVPPYDWSNIEQSEAAKEHFLDTMSEELLRPGSASGDYQRLLSAASMAWEEVQG